MAKGKKIRTKGKIKFSEYFKEISDGEKVAVVKELGVASAFPKRMIGKSGIVSGSRGNYKIIKMLDGKMAKTFIIHPIHLKKLK